MKYLLIAMLGLVGCATGVETVDDSDEGVDAGPAMFAPAPATTNGTEAYADTNGVVGSVASKPPGQRPPTYSTHAY